MNWLQTEQAGRVGRAIARLTRMDGVAMIHGHHGLGKSTALRMYAAEHEELLRVVVTPPTGEVSLKSFLADIARAIDLTPDYHWSASELAVKVAAAIKADDRLLVLDHAEYLRAVQLDHVRYLADLLPRMVLCGGPALYDKVVDARAAALRTRIRLPLEVAQTGLSELQSLLARQYHPDCVAAAYEDADGVLGVALGLLDYGRTVAEDSGVATLALEVDTLRKLGANFVVHQAVVAEAA